MPSAPLPAELVEYMRRVPTPGKEDQRPAGPSPIEHLQTHVLVHGYKLHRMARWIMPGGGLL
jgi:hypothetical protein